LVRIGLAEGATCIACAESRCPTLWLQNTDQNVFAKLGPYAWLAGAVLFTEILIVIKFGRGEFTAPFPEHVVLAWSIFGAVLFTGLIVWQVWIWSSAYFKRASPMGKGKKRH
jgi:hypothetical protein